MAAVRAEDYYERQKRKYATSTSVLQPQEEIERKKRFLLNDIYFLYKMQGKNMDVNDLISMLDISKIEAKNLILLLMFLLYFTNFLKFKKHHL